MAAYDIELILNRQLAECLSIPVFITDTNGNLIFYNEPAEDVLGKRFEDTGEMPVEQWSVDFKPVDDDGNPLPPDELPLVKTLKTSLPYHKTFSIISMRGKPEKISVTSYPIIGRTGHTLGAVAIFWKSKEE
ncbi:MAG: PAS domain-containing protein [Ginsengibacter sp.]